MPFLAPVFPFFDIAHYLVSVMALKHQPGECWAPRIVPLRDHSPQGRPELGERRNSRAGSPVVKLEGAGEREPVPTARMKGAEAEEEGGPGPRKEVTGGECGAVPLPRAGLPGQVT